MNIFETETLSIMPYLKMQGMKFIGCKAKVVNDRTRVVAQFEDPQNLGSEHVMNWNFSKEKQYRDLWTTFRNEIDKVLEGING